MELNKIIDIDFKYDKDAIDKELSRFIAELKTYVVSDHPSLFMNLKLKENIANLPLNERRRIFYDLIDKYNKTISPQTICNHKLMANNNGGCKLSLCCTLNPDVFEGERNILNSLPRINTLNNNYCSFFDVSKNICSVYEERPFSCRLFLNFENNQAHCLDGNNEMNSIKNVIFLFTEVFLGKYTGPYT